jgi:hypothetical protein
VELILIGAALAVGLLLIVLGRRTRKREPEGSVFDAAGGPSFRARKPTGAGSDPGRSRLGDLGTRRPTAPAPEPPGGQSRDLMAGPAPEPPPQPGPEPGPAPPRPAPPAPALPLNDAPPAAPALPLGDPTPPAWHAGAPDWSHALAPRRGLSAPPGGLDRELEERAERAERAREAELRERAEQGRRSDEPPDDT